MAKNTPRGIRLANPGNIRKTTDKWQGLADKQVDDEFFTFKSPAWGIRAMARILLRYQEHYELRSLEEIIRRWTPPVGHANGKRYVQDTQSAISNIEAFSGIERFESLNLQTYDDMEALVTGIIRQENGEQPYPQRVIDRGLELAGIVPEKRKATGSPEGQAGAIAGGTAGVAALVEVFNQVAPAIPMVERLAADSPIILGGGAVLAVAWFIHRRREDS